MRAHDEPTPPERPVSPLVGRQRELDALRGALDGALAGRGSLVLIGGEAGIGKTALAEWLCDEASGRGTTVLVGRCYDLTESPPYGPWAEALGRAPRGVDLPSPPDLAEGTVVPSQAALLAAVRGFLATLAAQQPTILLLDDLHWADLASLDLLRHLARSLGEFPLIVLVTYRADELTRRHPLYVLIPLLVREAHAVRLDLRPLDAAGLRAFVRTRCPLPPQDEDRLVTYLHGRAEGNPFFTGELLRALEEGGTLRQDGAWWVLDDPAGASVPPLLRQVIDARVDRLGEDARELLAAAAVIGQEVPLALWAAIAGADEDKLLQVAERAEEARLLAQTTTGVRFAHALIREALFEGLPGIRRRRLHLRVGEALAAGRAPDPDAVAYHFHQADDPRAVDWLLAAADRAEEMFALTTAIVRLELALRLLERAGTPAAERGWLLCRLATDWTGAGGSQRALASLAEAAQLAAEADDGHLMASVRCYQAGARFQAGDARRGLAELESAVADDPGTPPDNGTIARLLGRQEWARYAAGRFLGDLALWFAHTGRYAEIPPLLGRLIAHESGGVGARGPSSEASPAAQLALGRMQAALGEPEAALRSLEGARAGYGARRFWAQVAMSYFDELWHVLLPYRTDDAAAHVAVVTAFVGLPIPGAPLDRAHAGLRVPLLLLAGRWGEARSVGEAKLQEDLAFIAKSYVRQSLGWLAAAQGDAALLQTLLRELLPDGFGAEPGGTIFRMAVQLQRSAADLARDAGDLVTARNWLIAHDRWIAWSGSVLGRAEGQIGWAAYYRAAGHLSQARAHADHALAEANAPRQPLALLAAQRISGELATAAGDFVAARSHIDGSLALAEACAAPYERALTALALAELHAAIGEREVATRLLAEVRATLAPLEARPALARADALAARLAAPVPASAQAAGYPAGLSAREVEVLRLVARGLSNAEVGARLFLSPRTVQQHLRSVYNKLGVDNRAAATRRAIEHGLT